MRVHPHIPVGEIAASMPHLTKLFDILGIDYVLHGSLSLRDACAEAGADPVRVRLAIQALPADCNEKSWSDASMQELIDELRDRRHPRARALLGEAATRIGALTRDDAHTIALREAFCALCDVLQPHMFREEHMLFPVVQHLEDCWTHSEKPGMNFLGGVSKPMAALVRDHDAIIEKLRLLRTAAGELGEDAAGGTAARNAVDALEHELREHIHLENNVLYPRAAAIEAAVTQPV
jgi:regulator of cell morphogenesis and NO signaling